MRLNQYIHSEMNSNLIIKLFLIISLCIYLFYTFFNIFVVHLNNHFAVFICCHYNLKNSSYNRGIEINIDFTTRFYYKLWKIEKIIIYV